MTTKF